MSGLGGDAREESFVEVVKGNPTDEEIAAIVAVVSAVVAPTPEGPRAPKDAWGVDSTAGRFGNPNVPWSFPNISHLRW